MLNLKKYAVTLTTTSEMLGTISKGDSSGNTAMDYISDKDTIGNVKAAEERSTAPTVEEIQVPFEEMKEAGYVKNLKAGKSIETTAFGMDDTLKKYKLISEYLDEKKGNPAGWILRVQDSSGTGFHSDEKGIFIFDYMVRGFLKNAGNVIKGDVGIKQPKSKIDNFVFVKPRRIHLMLDGKNIVKPDGVISRPLRAMTMQGPRVTIAKSDFIRPGAVMNMEFHVVDCDDGKLFTISTLKDILSYGAYQGLGQFRNGSYGQFEFNIKAM